MRCAFFGQQLAWRRRPGSPPRLAGGGLALCVHPLFYSRALRMNPTPSLACHLLLLSDSFEPGLDLSPCLDRRLWQALLRKLCLACSSWMTTATPRIVSLASCAPG